MCLDLHTSQQVALVVVVVAYSRRPTLFTVCESSLSSSVTKVSDINKALFIEKSMILLYT